MQGKHLSLPQCAPQGSFLQSVWDNVLTMYSTYFTFLLTPIPSSSLMRFLLRAPSRVGDKVDSFYSLVCPLPLVSPPCWLQILLDFLVILLPLYPEPLPGANQSFEPPFHDGLWHLSVPGGSTMPHLSQDQVLKCKYVQLLFNLIVISMNIFPREISPFHEYVFKKSV